MLPKFRVLFFAGLAGKIAYALSSLVVLPALTSLLGQESIGLLGFFTSLLMVFMALDGGVTSAVTRKLAAAGTLRVRSPRRYRLYVFSVTNTFFLLFLALGVLTSGILVLGSGMLSGKWLNVEQLESSQVQGAIFWMGVFIGLNFPIMLLQAAFHGREMHVRLNFLYVPYAFARTLGVLAVLMLFEAWATIDFYFFLQALLQFCYLVLLVFFYFYGDGLSGLWVRPSVRFIRQALSFGSGVLMISLTSVAVVQIDKVYLSGQLSLSDYAVYTLAGTFASIPYILSSALYAALFPRFSTYYACRDIFHMGRMFGVVFLFFGSVLLVACVLIWFFSGDLLRLIFDDGLAVAVQGLLPILFIGTALQALLIVPYSLQLAVGWTSLALRINLLALPLILISLPVAVDGFGMLGAAWVWLSYNVLAFAITLYLMKRRFAFLRVVFLRSIKFFPCMFFLFAPICYAFELWVMPGLSKGMVFLVVMFLGAGSVALTTWWFRRDLIAVV
ncbi:MATE family efflux transporter [Ectopseudomonas guguanensis]|uniref:MATE family efflux transporter n=1 Tax=Ectopseudomonas guguanensis TaxID=1198456 RepID=UPI0023556D76|nr:MULTISPECIES: MATE family efflux transporter [Pseudomonas]